jgi:hypothetical protein
MRYYLTLNLFLLTHLVFAQLCDEKVILYGGDFDFTEISRVIRTSDGHFVLAGQKNAETLLMKVNDCGDVIWEKNHAYGSESSFRDVIQVGNKFIGLGYCETCRMNDSGRKILVQEMSGTGDLIGAPKLLGPANLNADAFRIRPASGNRYVVAGTRVITQGNVSGNAMIAYLLNSDLSTQTFEFYGLKALQETAYDVVEIPGTGFVLVGSSFQGSVPVSSQVRIIGTDGALKSQWTRDLFLTNSSKEQAGRAIGRMPNGDLVVAGSKLEGSNTRLFVGRFDPSSGLTKGEAFYGGSGDNFARDIMVTGPNQIVVAGMQGQAGVSENPWGMVLDGNLSILDEFQIPNQGLFNSGLSYDAGGKTHYVFAGTGLGFASRGILAKTISLPVYLDAVPATDQDLQIFPNPNRGRLHLAGWEIPRNARLSLLSMDGRILHEQAALPVVDLPATPAGSYLVRITWEGGQLHRPLVLID